MLMFEITKTNTPLPQKGLAPILIGYVYVGQVLCNQATISSVKHKALFHRNYLENYVPGNVFPQICCCLRFRRGLNRLGKSFGDVTLGLQQRFSIPSMQISDLHPL